MNAHWATVHSNCRRWAVRAAWGPVSLPSCLPLGRSAWLPSSCCPLPLSPVELAASCPLHPGHSGVSPLVSCASSCLWPWSLQGMPPTCVLAVALLLPTSPWTCRSSPPRARLPLRHQLPQQCWCQLAGPGDQGGAKWDLGIWAP